MLSAVETFGPAAAATHPYAHHHSFAIAAAAAAAVPAAAAAAAVMPPTQQLQASLVDHYTIGHTLSSQAGLFLPPPPPPPHNTQQLNNTALPDNLPLSGRRITAISSSSQSASDRIAAVVAATMSSAEFARPHPKHPRYNSSNSSANNNNNSNSSNNNNNNNTISNNNNNASSNGIPIHLRNTKLVNNCLSNSVPSPRTKYSSSEQPGPVNLVTNNNSNSSSSNSNSGSFNCSSNNSSSNSSSGSGCGSGNTSNKNSSPSSPQQQQQHIESLNGGTLANSQQSSPNETDVMAGIYAQKLPFTAPAVVTNNAAAAVAAAYQFNYPHIYGRGAIYGTTALYPGHHPLSSRSQLHSRPTYIGAQHEPFSPYLTSPVTYSPPSVPAPPGLLRPPPPPSQTLGLANPHSTANILNSSHNSNASNSLCPTQLPIMPDSRQHPSLHHIAPPPPPPQNLIGSERQLSSSSSSLSASSLRDKESMKTSTYLNGKVNPSSSSSSSVTSSGAAGFKVPSGKEGSLKHRILTRPPYSEKDSRRRSPITATVVRSSSGNSSTPSNFSKGAFIELANGVLRKVEDMRTEDFIQSAEKSPHHQLADSTVVKIVNTPNSVIITFSYDKNRSKADVEVSQEHPFFVYGQGWASCNPELSLQTFGLKCQRLQVGDICISLISRDTTSTSHNTTVIGATPQSPQSSSSLLLYSGHQHPMYIKEELSSVPQNLSRKSSPSSVNSSTIPTTATGTAVTSRLSAPIPHHLPPAPPIPSSGLPPTHITSQPPYERLHPYEVSPPISRHHSSPPSMSNGLPPISHHHQHHPHPLPHHHHHHSVHQQQQQHPQHAHRLLKPMGLSDARYMTVKNNGDMQTSPPLSLSAPSSRPPSNQPYYLGTGSDIPRTSSSGSASSGGGSGIHTNNDGVEDCSNGNGGHYLTPEQQAAAEASLSRKRRWSAPDICDDDGCQPTATKTMNNS